MFLIVLIGVLYILMGFVSIITALLFIELGRPKDLIKSGLLILLGTYILIYKNIFTFKISFILTLNSTLITFYFIEIFSYRWNLLLEKEKIDIQSLSGLKEKFSIIYKIISVDFKNLFLKNKFKNIFKNTSIKKKWVRKQDNNLMDKEASSKEYMTNIQTPDFSKKDIISDEKNISESTKIDNL